MIRNPAFESGLCADSNSSARAADDVVVVQLVNVDGDVDNDKTRDSYATIAFSRIVDRGMDFTRLPLTLRYSNVTATAPDDDDDDEDDAKAPSCSVSVDIVSVAQADADASLLMRLWSQEVQS